MITKAEILSIDFNSNKCAIRIPYFESAGTDGKITAEATFINPPGIYNGYKVGDIVLISFEDNRIHQPVIIGKLYLGANLEKQNTGGSINCESLVINKDLTLPISTKIESAASEKVATISGSLTTFKSIQEIINAITALQQKVSTSTNGTFLITDQVTNIHGYTASTYTYDEAKGLIKYNGSENMTVDQAKIYMQYMTGNADVPIYDNKYYGYIFIKSDFSEKYYPKWDSEEQKLYLVKI